MLASRFFILLEIMAGLWRLFFSSYENLEANKVRFWFSRLLTFEMFQDNPQQWTFLERFLCLKATPVVEKAKRGQIDVDQDLWEIEEE